MSYSGTHLET